MTNESTESETCVVCGKLAEGDAPFSHLYHGGRRFPLCCPICQQLFQRAPDRFANGERCQTLIDELLGDMRWKDPAQS